MREAWNKYELCHRTYLGKVGQLTMEQQGVEDAASDQLFDIYALAKDSAEGHIEAMDPPVAVPTNAE